MTCDELEAMVEGGQAVPAETVYAHVDACPTCARLIATRGWPDTALSPTLLADSSSQRAGAAAIPGQIGRFEVQAVLGTGGMGVVYAAWDPDLRRAVALKVVRPDRAVSETRQQLLREARALARISHPNVVTAHDVGEHGGEVFVATELVAGKTLASWYGGRSRDEIVAAWIQAARGLAAAHAEGVVHRDVKPHNVLVGADGRVRIGDFGLAVQGTASASGPILRPRGSAPDGATATVPGDGAPIGQVVVTATGFFGGTPGYMAPEHEHGKAADARSDQFSLCVSIAETLTGERPCADARPDVQPPALAAALERGLRADPEARFPSVTDLADALAAAVAPRRRRWPLAVAAAGAGVLVAGTALAWMAIAGGGRDDACEVVQVPPDLWPASRRAALDRAVGPAVSAYIDFWLGNWSAAAADVCTPGRASPEIRSRQRACLSRELTDLREQLDTWGTAPPSEPLPAIDDLERIELPSRCSHAAVAGSPEPPGARREEVEGLRDELSAVRPGDGSPAVLARITPMVARARRLGHAPLLVQALMLQAEIQVMRDPAAAAGTLREAVAAAGPDHYSRVLAAIQLLGILGGDAADEATRLAESARSDLGALGGDPLLEAEIDFNLASIWSGRRDYDQSIAAFDRARRGFRAAFGPGSLYEAVALYNLAGVYMGRDGASSKGAELLREAGAMYQRAGVFMPVPAQADDPAEVIEATEIFLAQARSRGPNSEVAFQAENNLADAYTVAGDDERALDHYLRAIDLGERLKLRDVRLVGALSQAAYMTAELGRPADGLAHARRAAELADELGAESEIGTALTMLGRLLLDSGRRAEARPYLERALQVREKLREPGRFRGNTRYLLATSLWPADKKRARELAYAARVDIQADIDSLPQKGTAAAHVRDEQRARLARIDAWLRAHR